MSLRAKVAASLGLAVAGVGLPHLATGPAHAADPVVALSGVVDGPLTGGLPKVVEITAVTDVPDTSVIGLGIASNGGSSDGVEMTLPPGSLTAGESICVATETDGFTAFFDFAPDATRNVSINGDDAIELFVGDTLADTYGEVGVDGTGMAWDHLDGWAKRDAGTGPDGLFAAENWTFSGPNALDGATSNEDAATPFPASCDGPAGDGGGEEPTTAAIADIQGSGSSTPMSGDTVTTTGVVTALYPDGDGSLNGFYLQTGGTGGSTDATPGRSDALFVYGRNVDETTLSIGDAVRVTGVAGEFGGVTQLTADTGGVEQLTEPLSVTPAEIAYPTTGAEREAHEGELLAPTDRLTVTNVYTTNQYAEIGLATGTTPLIQPTDVAAPGTAAYQAVIDDNAARGVLLDDASSLNFLDYGSSEQDIPLPWLSPGNPIRVGAEATLTAPVILGYGFGNWRFLPQRQVTDEGTDMAVFENTRAQNQAPAEVGGDLALATFNVLNYFNTTGVEFEANGGSCSYYNDRDGNPIATNRCSNPDGSGGPRGAANEASFERQEEKIVAAINGLGADIVALEELENSIRLVGETDRDDAIAELVGALNEAAGAGTWEYVASPKAAYAAPHVAEQDVIRNGFIYKPASVKPLGRSEMLLGDPVFANAREPLAQAFRAVGVKGAQPFTVIANHFKSKGCGGASGDNADGPQGCYNGDRQRQAMALANFAADFAESRGTEAVFLVGDINSYTQEDPMQVLYGEGYQVVESDQPGDWSYSFSGLSGSLDHVLGNAAAMAMVTGADVWEINANEAIAFQYSRYNYNATNFHQPGPFAASDHNPEVVGLSAR